MNIDMKKLRAAIGATAMQCSATKRLLGTTWTRPMADEQRRLARLRRQMTELCILAAHARGRHHVREVPRAWGSPRPFASDDARAAWHAEIAARVAKDYVPAAAHGGEEAAS